MTKPLAPPSHLWELSQQAVEDGERWFGDSNIAVSIPHHTLALCGEAGEVANIVKKIERGSLSMNDAHTRYQLMMEIVDVFTYTLNLAYLCGLDLERGYEAKRTENQKRFTEERARREGAIG